MLMLVSNVISNVLANKIKALIITNILIKVILYLLVAIASFANYLPEIAELLGNRPKYGGSYKVIYLAIKYMY